MNIGIIGAGKVGCSLGGFLGTGGIRVTGYFSRNPESAREAAEFTNSKFYDTMEAIVRDCDVIFITVPDGAIAEVYNQICRYEIQDKFICHCSGALASADAFPGIGQQGAHGFSIHPLFPISTKYETYRELAGAFFCTEGDEEGLDRLEPLFRQCGATVMRIAPEVKVRYHAACVAASNFMCGLAAQSVELLEGCGFTPELAMAALAPLMRSNLEHLIHVGPTRALTGPVERCDTGTVRKHLNALNEEDMEFYRLMSRRLTRLAEKKNPERDYTSMNCLLDQERME